ncbi:hypothetical protein [Parasphingorhabdus sp.]|uniref:hypothetical protein n=1 Tax=Parasphingorhabdus sp. TaxID=2709688 RepID=UPI002B27BCBD|nr:hypothetical protein [Parasphingorhabdus sp.]
MKMENCLCSVTPFYPFMALPVFISVKITTIAAFEFLSQSWVYSSISVERRCVPWVRRQETSLPDSALAGPNVTI